jgi:hypothetical protein
VNQIDASPLDTSNAWDEFAQTTRQINHANGWGLDYSDDKLPAYIALIHSEVSEAHQEVHADEIAGELADVVIRCADVCELISPGEFGQIEKYQHEDSLLDSSRIRTISERSLLLMEINVTVTHALEAYRKQTSWKSHVIEHLRLAAWMAYDLAIHIQGEHGSLSREQMDGILWAKLEKNRGRGYRHGNRRA